MIRTFVLLAVGVVLIGGAAWRLVPTGAQPPMAASPMSGMGAMDAEVPNAPPVKGYTEGQEIHFIHTEASDPGVARMLIDMMGGSPVLVVPSLAQAPDAMLANVYVFTNGIAGDGPFGFQPDVFDRPPGDPEYSPLRSVSLVAWSDEQNAHVLTFAEEVLAAEAEGEARIEQPGIVVNMPFLTWPGGQR
ncbi:MAG: DUF7482 domain-containing protein [Thermomicrobiales bacterium]